jgi:transcriptional regulator NrdR family protein
LPTIIAPPRSWCRRKTCKTCKRRATTSGKVQWRHLRLGANGRLPAAAELTDEDVVRMVKESR